MKKEKATVSFLPIWGKNGTVYRCNVRVSQKIYSAFVDVLEYERTKAKDHVTKMYLDTFIERLGNVYFLNLTQAKLFKEWLFVAGVEVNKQRLFYNANTSIIIDDQKK